MEGISYHLEIVEKLGERTIVIFSREIREEDLRLVKEAVRDFD